MSILMNKKTEENITSSVGNYYIGLDIGTDSVGWAVTDLEYRLIKSGGKPLWGAYLFSQAESAEKRRQFRTSRRRTARVRQRLLLLQSLFAEEVQKTDPTFFIRLNNSALHFDDKDERISTKYLLFGDSDYNDKTYFEQFPTIFHLRKYLTENAPQDIRLLYLACHHILKNRGHFLFDNENMTFDGEDIARKAFNNINAALDDGENAIVFDSVHIDEALNILKERDTKSDKQRALNKLFGISSSDKRAVAAVKLITGGSCNASVLYGTEFADDIKIDMSAMDDVKFEQIKSAADDDCLLDGIKAIYDWSVLVNILKGEKSISRARVRSYDTHKADLALLKKYVKEKCPYWYDEKNKLTYMRYVFRYVKGVNNYAAYIGMDKHKSYAKASKDEFYDFLKKNVFGGQLEKFKTFIDEQTADNNVDYICTAYDRFNNGDFLPKQITGANGVIPYQLHKYELQKILDKAKNKYEFLNQKDDSGLTVAEKIVELLVFCIPYYVGPLGGGRYAWAVRKEGNERTKITPWNFDEVIDKDASEEKFIKNMTCKCTYIPTEDVLPADSLLYKEAIFLNELNNLKINGVKDSKVIDLIYDYAHTDKKITRKKILNILKINGYDMSNITAESISGIDGDMKNSLSSYIEFNKILNGDIENEREMCEEIILWSTLVSDKDRLEKRIAGKYGKKLSSEQIKRIKGLTFTKWGRLSKALLDGIVSEKSIGIAGNCMTVIETMRTEKINLSEALTSARRGFADAIEKYNCDFGGNNNKKIDDLYCSPSVKRAIRRTLAVVKEIVKIEGCAPKKIMIEVTRGGTEEQKGKRTKSKKQQLLDLYTNVKSDVREFSRFISEIENKDERDFASKRLFAYYMQQGRCMYSDEPIDINRLFDRNAYDFDHIYPQSKVNDDSFDNRVLVKKELNARKTDNYPIPYDIQNKMKQHWTFLHKNGFISDKKYERLTRTTPLSPSELAEFENRQLVITAQSTKIAANILRENFPDSEIVYSKASKAAEFKHNFGMYAEKAKCDEKYRGELIKVRELNNLHHAKDAYVNIVVGNVLNTEYGHDATVFYKNKDERDMKSDYALFRWGVKGAWDPQRDIPTVFDTYYTDNCRVVRFVKEETGQLYDLQMVKPKNKLIPIKGKGKISDTSKYGGYDKAKIAYYVLVKSYDENKEPALSIEAVPIRIDKLMAYNKLAVQNYIEKECGLLEPKIVIPKIRKYSLFIIDGSPAYITGKTNEYITFDSATELILDRESIKYIKQIMMFNKKYEESIRYKREIKVNEEFDKININHNIDIYDKFIQKLGLKMYSGLSMKKQQVTLLSCREQFIKLSLEKQCGVLIKILQFLNAKAPLNMSDFNKNEHKKYGTQLGVNTICKSIDSKNIKWIVQSPTGRYRQVIDFKKFL